MSEERTKRDSSLRLPAADRLANGHRKSDDDRRERRNSGGQREITGVSITNVVECQ
jgi:hypothetical protein